jgi:antitoxin component YwqK of YwqJK toxin-antitoxin module
VSEFYHSNGNLRKIISFDANGNRDGDWMDYHPNGKIKQKISFQSGKIIDSLVRYNLEGEIIINQ